MYKNSIIKEKARLIQDNRGFLRHYLSNFCRSYWIDWIASKKLTPAAKAPSAQADESQMCQTWNVLEQDINDM